jgi:hypothetical protein
MWLRRGVSVGLMALALLLIAGCGGSDDAGGSDAGSADAGGSDAGSGQSPATSTLNVVLEDAPAGAEATVIGPKGFSETVSADTTFEALPAGIYAIEAQPLLVEEAGYWPTSSAAVSVAEDASATLSVRWREVDMPFVYHELAGVGAVTDSLVATVRVFHPEPSAVVLSAASDDEALLPTSSIALEEVSDGRYELTLEPAEVGRATLTLTATDALGQSTAAEHSILLVDRVVTNRDDDGPGSLRDAVETATAGEVIGFADHVRHTIVVASPLQVAVDLALWGPGAAELTLSGANATRVLEVEASFYMRGLRIAKGVANQGGGMFVHGSGAVHVEDSVFEHNRAQGGSPARGGALFISAGASGELRRTAFLNNDAIGSLSAESSALVFAMPFLGSQVLVLDNCTFSGNRVLLDGAEEGGSKRDDAISSFGHLVMRGTTIAGNSGGLRLVHGFSGQVSNVDVGGNIIAGNQFFDFNDARAGNPSFTSLGGNLIGTTEGATWDGAGDLTGIGDPLLGPPSVRGGTVPTRALLPDSPARGIVPAAAYGGEVTTDARGVPRRVLGTEAALSDSGAFEAQAGE